MVYHSFKTSHGGISGVQKTNFTKHKFRGKYSEFAFQNTNLLFDIKANLGFCFNDFSKHKFDKTQISKHKFDLQNTNLTKHKFAFSRKVHIRVLKHKFVF